MIAQEFFDNDQLVEDGAVKFIKEPEYPMNSKLYEGKLIFDDNQYFQEIYDYVDCFKTNEKMVDEWN